MTKSVFASKLNWLGAVTFLISLLTYLQGNESIPAEWASIIGAAVGILTILVRTFGTSTALTVGGKQLS